MYRVADIAVENAAYAYDKLYRYHIPAQLARHTAPGCRVTVPFGGGNRRRTGIVVNTAETDSRQGLKPVTALLDEEPLLDAEALDLLRYLKEHTFCTWYDALRLLIPAGAGIVRGTEYTAAAGKDDDADLPPRQAELLAYLRGRKTPVEGEVLCRRFGIAPGDPGLASLVAAGLVACREKTRQRIRDDKICMVRLAEDWKAQPLSPKQRQVVDFLEDAGSASRKEICYYTGVTRGVVDALERKGIAVYFDAVRPRSPFSGEAPSPAPPPVLSEEQRAAYRRLAAIADEEHPKPALLYGVTGAGKTEVFLELIRHVTEKGRGAIVLVPEISLTAQMVDGFRRRFGDAVAVLHSALSLGERLDEWKRIRRGDAAIVVGTRSAVFAPVKNLGLLVIDEEQEHTYRSDRSPRFHAREVALRRCAADGGLLLLSSATPSIESYHSARQGRYHLVTLTGRWGSARLPDVYIVDMRQVENVSQHPSFSQQLLEEMHYNLEHGEQSILLLNRRGYSTVVKCGACGTVADCPHCSVALTFHAANDSLLCHTCGYIRGRADTCAHCGSELIRYTGTGTQRLEEALGGLFPQARVLRVDMDTTMAKFSHERLFAAFSAREYDIMIGTQMVAKGLNFPDVTLVGVLNADQSLYAGDFRSYERSFSLLTQVVGRCGRGDKRGRAFIQTFSPENPVIHLASHQNYDDFYTQEVESRRLHLYPPFCAMAAIGFVGEDLEEVRLWAGRYLQQLCQVARERYESLPIRVLGPVPGETLKAAGKYRYKLVLKCRNSPQTRALLREILTWFYTQCKTVSVFVDMHCDRF